MPHDHSAPGANHEATDHAALEIHQDWSAYTDEQHDVWRLLYERRVAELMATGSRRVLEGIGNIGLRPDAVPDLRDVNARLALVTGWQAVPVAGFIPAGAFFMSLAVRRFPTTITVRPRQQLDYLPEPDIFHDVFGHVPLHADPSFADALQQFGALGAAARDEHQRTALARLFWFTIEFGLVRERGEPRIFGSGLVSSAGDAANALGPSCERRPFALDTVLAQPFEIDHLQPVLFVLESFEQLLDAIGEAGRRLDLAPRPDDGFHFAGRSAAHRSRTAPRDGLPH